MLQGFLVHETFETNDALRYHVRGMTQAAAVRTRSLAEDPYNTSIVGHSGTKNVLQGIA